MKKLAFSIFLTLSFSLAFSQSKTATYQGRTVNVFPYRIQIGKFRGYDSRNSLFENITIPYCPDKLEDGEYIIYYKPEIDLNDEKSYEQFAKGDTIFIAANFSIKNGVKEGDVYFFEYKFQKKPIVTGHYSNDQKSGIWTTESKSTVAKVEYKAGVMDGVFEYREVKNKLFFTGTFKNGKPHGTSYGYMGKKMIFSMSFKDGIPYGPYYESKVIPGFTFNEVPQNGVYYEKGYKILGMDSILQRYGKKNQLLESYTNSKNYPREMDTAEKQWFINAQSFGIHGDEAENSLIPDMDENSEVPNIYTHCYQISKKGKRINDYYLMNGKIKVPFVILNEDEDTIMVLQRGTYTNSSKILQIKKVQFSTKGKKSSESYSKVEIFNRDSILPERWGDKIQISGVTFYNKEIVKNYNLNMDAPGYKGFIKKVDSSITINRVTMKPIEINEKYSIDLLNFSYRTKTQFTDSKNEGVQTITPRFEMVLKGEDTLELIDKEEISNKLYSVYSRKICFKDSTILLDGNRDLISPSIALGLSSPDFRAIGKDGNRLYYLNKLYTGGITIETKKSKKKKPETYEMKNSILYITNWVKKERRLRSLIKSKHLFRKRNYYDDFNDINLEEITFNFNYKNGVLDGRQWAEGKYSDNIFEINYKNGINHGNQIYSESRSSRLSQWSNKIRINYDSGLIDGYAVRIGSNDKIELFTKYNKGKLNGTYNEFDTDYPIPTPSLEANFVNDTLDGNVLFYHNGFLKSTVPFKQGEASGYYYGNHIQFINEEHSDSAHFYKSYTKFYPETKIKLWKGNFVDTTYGYFENGGIKYTAIIDTSVRHQIIQQFNNSIEKKDYVAPDSSVSYSYNYPGSMMDYEETVDSVMETVVDYGYDYDYSSENGIVNFGLESISSSKKIELDPLYDIPKATFTFYYKNGIHSQQGTIYDGLKTGTWKYWNENGVLMKEVEYKQGYDSSTQNTVYYQGKITAYYPSGKKLLEGLIVDQELSYQCNQEAEIAYEDVYYLNFYDEQGNPTFIKNSGMVSDYHLNGNKRLTGQITNGLKTGLWKYFDPNGNLMAIGEFADGYKQGKWLEGDLGGVNFLDNACSVNEALELIKAREQQDIDVTESLYEMGQLISQSHLVLEKF